MNGNGTNILLVEDNPGDARLIREELKEALGGKFSLVHADCLETCLNLLEQKEFDVILLDLGLPDSQGFDTLVKVRAKAKIKVEKHPIIILTGLDSEDMAIMALREGAQDYLVKGQIDARILKRAIQYSIERKKNREELHESEEKYRLLIESMQEGVWVIDANTSTTFVNRRMAEMLGYTVEEMTGYRILRSPDFSVTFLGLNRDHPPLNRSEVRSAVAMAIDRAKLLTPAAAGVTTPATGILPPRMAGYRPEPKVLPFSPDSARALLGRAGYRPDHPVPPIDFYSSSPDTSRYTRELRRQLEVVGISLRTHELPWSALDACITRGDAPMFELSWIADIPDPDAILYSLFRSGEPNNLFSFHDATVDSLLEAGRRLRPGAERFELYRHIESVILAEAPMVPLFTGISLYVWDPRVRGVDPNPFGFSLTPFDRIWFAPPGVAGDPLTERLP